MSLFTARTRIHISFGGGWLPGTIHNALAVFAHYIDASGDRRSIPLALQPIHGLKNGPNLADVLVDILDESNITKDRLGFYDAAIALLQQAWGFQARAWRLCCIGHILNLVAKSLIFANNLSELADIIKALGSSFDQQVWRGLTTVINHLHDIVWINSLL